MKKGTKILITILVTIVVLVTIVLFAIPRLLPNYIESNSQELIGRKVDIGEIRLNYATLHLSITDFVLYETDATSSFVSFDEFSVNLDLIPTLRGNYTISSLLLDNINVNIEFDGEKFNFDDMIVEADTTTLTPEMNDADSVEDLRFTLDNIELRSGDMTFYDSHEDVHHELSNIGFVLPHFSWDNSSTSEMDLAFNFEPQGRLELKADVDYPNQRYELTAKIIDLALAPFSVYLQSMLASEGITGTLNNRIYVNGAIDNPTDVLISGSLEVSDFSLKDEKGDTLFQNGLLGIYLDSIDMQNNYYGISKILVSAPQVYAELYESTTNFEQLLSPMLALPDSVSEDSIAATTSTSDSVFFQIDTFLLDKGAVFLADYTLNRPFKYEMTSMYTLVTDINPITDHVAVAYDLIINKSATLKGDAIFSMLDANKLNYSAELKGLDLTSFSPYSEYYVARSIERGHFNFTGQANMSATTFNADNDISINDINLGAKTNDEAQVKVPVKLALGILKDKNGDVKFDVPLSGNPSDPDFNVGKIIGKTLSDFVIKVAAAPFAIVGDIAGVNPERLKEITIDFTQYQLNEKEIKTLEQMALALEKKPELWFHFTLEVPAEKEMKAFAVKQLKSDYLIALETETADMEEALLALSNEDHGLVAYVTEKSQTSAESSFAEQCVAVVGEEKLIQELIALEASRNAFLQSYLLDTLQLNPESIDIRPIDAANHKVDIDQSRFRVEVSVK